MFAIMDNGEELMIGKVPYDDDDLPYWFKFGESGHVLIGWDMMCAGEKLPSATGCRA